MLKKNSPIPLYTQLIDELINEIESNYEPDTKIMSEREICERYDVSRTTVRLALMEMENMGYIYKKHGKGTFVSKKAEDKKNLVEAYSFTEHMKRLSKEPNTIIVSLEEIPINKHVAEKMNASNATEVYRLERIRLADNEPMMYEISYLPISIFQDLNLEKVSKKPLYDLFRDEYQQTVQVADEEFSAGIVRKKEAEMLKIQENSACFRIQRLSYNEQSEVIEYTLSAARADQFVYKIRHEN